jgi:hypothetical protein
MLLSLEGIVAPIESSEVSPSFICLVVVSHECRMDQVLAWYKVQQHGNNDSWWCWNSVSVEPQGLLLATCISEE